MMDSDLNTLYKTDSDLGGEILQQVLSRDL